MNLFSIQTISLNIFQSRSIDLVRIDRIARQKINQPCVWMMLFLVAFVNPVSAHPLDKPAFHNHKTPLQAITGRVTNIDNQPMVGVSILFKGSNQQTITDAEGKYNLTTPGNGVLVFTYVGYLSREVAVNNRTVVDVVLEQTASELPVVIAYGTQKKASLTAAVSTISGKKIANAPVANLSNALAGKVPGLITQQGSGEPGNDQSAMYIRGISTTGGNQPLLIVDGIPRSFTQLNPQTIESITVLKDAAAVAPYGVAGANGVILVTTKIGKTGSPTLSLNSSYGIMNLTNIPELPTGYEFATLKNAAAINEGLTPPYSAADLQKFQDGSDPDRYANTNAHDLMIHKNTPLTSHSIEISGGTDKVKYYGSLGYMYQQGIFTPIKTNRYTLSLNLDAKVTPTTTLAIKLNNRQQDNSKSGIATQDLFVFLNYALPTQPIFWSNGKPATYVYPIIYESGSNINRGTQIFSQVSIDQKFSFIPGLSFKGTFAYDPTSNKSKIWVTPTHVWAADFTSSPYKFTDAIYGNTKASLAESYSESRSLTYQAQLNYNRSFGKSDISALALFEARDAKASTLSASRINYNLLASELSLGSSNPLDITNSGSSSRATSTGLVYRVAYGLAGKYFAEVNGRYDGSYYFAPGKKYGFFPAGSVGWLISEEPFIKNHFAAISNLKIKGSYGEVGALAGSAFQYLSTYSVNSNVAVLGGTAVQGIAERNEANRNITWERAKISDVGLELSLWKDLLTVEFDYFLQKRSNMLTSPTITTPLEYGVNLSQINAGQMKNQGYEISVGSRYNVSSDLHLGFTGNITHAKNTLLQVFETASTYNNPNRRITGRSLGTQFGYDATGFYLPEDFVNGMSGGTLNRGVVTGPTTAKLFPGDLKYRDVNGDGKIDQNDIVPIGDPFNPQISYGLNPNIRYKSFQLDLLFQGAFKRDVYFQDWVVWPFNVGRGAYKHNLNYWRPDNLNALNPRITSAPATNNTQVSSWWMSDGSYLRIKNVQLSYSLPENLIQKLGMRTSTLYLAAQNLKTWSNMKWDYDPEASNVLGSYPSEQVITVGINVIFK